MFVSEAIFLRLFPYIFGDVLAVEVAVLVLRGDESSNIAHRSCNNRKTLSFIGIFIILLFIFVVRISLLVRVEFLLCSFSGISNSFITCHAHISTCYRPIFHERVYKQWLFIVLQSTEYTA